MANEELVKEFTEVNANLGVTRSLKESIEAHLRLSKTNRQDQKEKLRTEIEKQKAELQMQGG